MIKFYSDTRSSHMNTNYMNYTLLKSSIICMLITLSLFGTSASATEVLSVKGDKVNMRSGPGIQYLVKWEYGTGFPLEILKKQGDWLQVKDFEDEIGWIHKSHLHKNSQMIVKANKNHGQTVNIRSGPGNENTIVGNAHHGVVFSKLEVKSDWVKVQHESGLTGWIKKSFLWGN